MFDALLNWKEKRLLAKMSRQAAPSVAARLAIREHFEKAGYLSPIPSSRVLMRWEAVVASITLIVSLSGGTVAYAYASDEVLPDHPLYALRSRIEQVEAKLAFTEEKKERVQLQQLERRLKEARLINKKQENKAQSGEEKIKNREKFKQKMDEIDERVNQLRAKIELNKKEKAMKKGQK